MVVVSNNYLGLEDMTINADYILGHLLSKGWTKNSVCGMLGNMQTESTINPGLWQNRDEGNTSLGFGLVQWTPATKFINWANDKGYDKNDIDGQLERLDWEIENNVQWIKTTAYPMTFEEFKVSGLSPEYLAQAFLRNYERPKNQNQPIRSTQARYWFDNLDGEGVCIHPAYPAPADRPISSPYGWRTNPVSGKQEFHSGIDIGGGGQNLPVYATQTGIVIKNVYTSYGGWTIWVKHTEDEYYSLYQHMNVRSKFEVNMPVIRGEQVGNMGATGEATGPHLHFVISTNGTQWTTEAGTIDPELYFLTCSNGSVTPPDPEPNPNDKTNKFIEMLLSDALNGWKY